MVCMFTIALGLVILVLGLGGSVKVGTIAGMTISGSIGGVILVLGLIGIGC